MSSYRPCFGKPFGSVVMYDTATYDLWSLMNHSLRHFGPRLGRYEVLFLGSKNSWHSAGWVNSVVFFGSSAPCRKRTTQLVVFSTFILSLYSYVVKLSLVVLVSCARWLNGLSLVSLYLFWSKVHKWLARPKLEWNTHHTSIMARILLPGIIFVMGTPSKS